MKARRIVGIVILAVVALGVVGALWIKWHGFRASSTPPAIEAGAARSIRNFAIPGAERKRTNPFTNDDVALEQGREQFMARCANCHGVDGYGNTVVGANEYPRVPDLHSDLTQQMSDGEIHYIIQNGVQLTGMPAMQGIHSETDSNSWKLV
ncbi:MAG TPA: c-type cytochrome, partial [Edaphobacter sp.]|uniref:c-type cytochrome n=1 Tax=Edaphobacter sp. TaxID=1934404 RepID=UPI002BF96F10